MLVLVLSVVFSCFIYVFLFLNILIHNLDQNRHKVMITLSLFIYTFFGSIPTFEVSMNYVSWFCVLYFISSYIRKYGLISKIRHRDWGVCTLFSVLLSLLSVICILCMNEIFGTQYTPFIFVSDSNAIFVLTTSVCSFMFFKDLYINGI